MNCYFCNKTVDEDYFCHGCEQPICDDCDTHAETPFGAHAPENHRECMSCGDEYCFDYECEREDEDEDEDW